MNLHRIIIFIISFLFSVNLNQWENISSDLSPNHLLKIDDKLYGSTQGGIFVYNLNNKDFSLNNHEHCLNVSSIATDADSSLWVLCESGILYKQNSNLIINHLESDIQKANDFIIYNQKIYVIYENDNIYGILDFSFDDNNIVYEDYYESFTQSVSEVFNSIIVLDNFIYLLTDSSIYYADVRDNLKFADNWNLISDVDAPLDIVEFSNSLVFIYSDSAYIYQMNENSILTQIDSISFELGDFIDVSTSDNTLTILGKNKVISIDHNLDVITEYTDEFENAISIFSDLEDKYVGINNQGFWILDSNIQKCAPKTLLSANIEALAYKEINYMGLVEMAFLYMTKLISLIYYHIENKILF